MLSSTFHLPPANCYLCIGSYFLFFILIYDSGMNADIEFLLERFKLSPYQTYILTRNGDKYNLRKIKKFRRIISTGF